MAQLTTQKTEAMPRSTRRPAEPGWLWLVLVGGSVAAHLLAVALVLPFVGRAAPKEAAIDATPIDFVALPSNPAPLETAPKPIEPAPAPAQAAPPTQTAPSDISIVSPSAPPSAVAPTTAPLTPENPIPENPAAAQPDLPVPSQPTEAQPPTATQPPTLAAEPQPAEPQLTEPQPAEPQLTEPQTSAPLIVTERIDRAVPDVSETLPIDPTAPTPLAQVNTDREAQPISLVASLQAVDIPPEQLETPPPDTIAQPGNVVDGISRQSFVADPQASACVPDAAAVPAIGSGAQVAVQVSTDAAGRVVEAAVLQPSQNPAYDQLAVCLVQQWSFQPATAQGQPVPSRALVVWVSIDRG